MKQIFKDYIASPAFLTDKAIMKSGLYYIGAVLPPNQNGEIIAVGFWSPTDYITSRTIVKFDLGTLYNRHSEGPKTIPAQKLLGSIICVLKVTPQNNAKSCMPFDADWYLFAEQAERRHFIEPKVDPDEAAMMKAIDHLLDEDRKKQEAEEESLSIESSETVDESLLEEIYQLIYEDDNFENELLQLWWDYNRPDSQLSDDCKIGKS